MLNDGFHEVPKGKLAMIVTHLEMRARADTRPVPNPDKVEIHPIENITVDEYLDLYRRIGENWLWFSRLNMNEIELSQIIDDPKVVFFTLMKNGVKHALLELDFRKSGECELVFFGLTKELIGSGTGRYLMNHAIDVAWSHDITRFHVHTCTIDSPTALNFYIRSGFTAIHRQVEIADDPRISNGWDTSIAPQVPIIQP
jgi:GNAT superfamily N-acetyltransferase